MSICIVTITISCRYVDTYVPKYKKSRGHAVNRRSKNSQLTTLYHGVGRQAQVAPSIHKRWACSIHSVIGHGILFYRFFSASIGPAKEKLHKVQP